MIRSRSLLTNVGLVAFSLALSLVLVEGALRVFHPVELRIRGEDIRLPYFKRYEMDHERARKLDSRIVHTRNALGFRGANPPRDFAQRLTIVTVGGSTTESFYLSDGKTWPALLGRRLSRSFPGLWINNAGLSGHTTFGHLRLLEQHVVALRPKVALFLIGINDRAKSEMTVFDRSLATHSRGWLQDLKKALVRNSEAAALLWNGHRTLKATRLGIDDREMNYSALKPRDATLAEEAEVLARHPPHLLQAYARRVEALVDVSRHHGIMPVLITHPALYGPAVDEATGIDLGRIPADPVNGRVAWRVLELYNRQTRQVARTRVVPLVDLAREMPKSSRLYYDMIHFSNDGAKAVAAILARHLCPLLRRHFLARAAADCGNPSP